MYIGKGFKTLNGDPIQQKLLKEKPNQIQDFIKFMDQGSELLYSILISDWDRKIRIGSDMISLISIYKKLIFIIKN